MRAANRSIDVTKDEDNYSDIDEANELAAERLGSAQQARSAWELGGDHKNNVIQNLLYLGGQLGFYHMEPQGAGADAEAFQQKVFYRGIYAPDEVDALRRLLIEQDDPVERQLAVYVASIKLVPQFLVPLFYQSVDEKPFALSLIRLFLLLTKPLAKSVVQTSCHIIKKSKGKETVAEQKSRVSKEQQARTNAYSQIAAQLSYKEALTNKNVFVVLLKYLEEPLSKPSNQRSEEDKVVIESILTLINNLLRISSGPFSSESEVDKSYTLQDQLILELQGPFLDIILLLCQGVMERDNYPWRVILVEIIHFILLNRDAKCLYKTFASDEAKSGAASSRATRDTNTEVTSGLIGTLKSERSARQAISRHRMTNRHSRFTGQYVVPSSLATVKPVNNADGSETSLNTLRASNMIISNPMCKTFGRPDVPRRSEKRSAPFNVDDTRSMPSTCGNTMRAEVQRQATRVVTDFLQSLLETAFSELVFSVKEGWRRGVDEADGMTGEEELGYYMMVTTCLSFHRLKQLADQKKSNLATRGISDSTVMEDDRWAPDLVSVTQCFDRMSFIRPVDFINRLKRVDKKPEKIVFVMELYTELVCYLRLMVESIEPAHNDVALAALYKIFYIRQEREDPLPSLLREWAPGTYGRRHLVGLVTLGHEIMKTLDAARIRFREEARMEGLVEDIDVDAKKGGQETKIKRKATKASSDSERSMYLVAACKFEPEEYLKRVMCTNQAVKIYTSLLELYKSNTPAVNYYIQVFIQRLCLFKIEDDDFGEPSRVSGDSNNSGVSLGHMFFNIRSLHAFNAVLQDTGAERDANLSGLVRLIKQLVIQFGGLVQRNRLAFVESLFTPSYPSHHSFLQVVDSVYDAKRTAIRSENGGYYGEDLQKANYSGSDASDYGDEFDESGDYATRVATKPALDKKPGSSKRRSRSKGSKWTWSLEEDKMLKEKYQLYAGTSSIFEMIKNDEDFRSLGGDRSKTAIEKRVRALNLHLQYSDPADRDMESTCLSFHGDEPDHSLVEHIKDSDKSKDVSVADEDDELGNLKSNSSGGDNINIESSTVGVGSMSQSDTPRDIWDDDGVGSGDEKWTGYRAFRPQNVASMAETVAPTLKRNSLSSKQDDEEWGSDSGDDRVDTSSSLPVAVKRRKILEDDDSDS